MYREIFVKVSAKCCIWLKLGGNNMRKSVKLCVLAICSTVLFSCGCSKEAPGKAEIVEDAVQINIDNSKGYQTIEGFGAGFTYYSHYTYYAQYKDEVYDLLFKDAHLNILRFKNKYKYEEDKEFITKVEKEYYDKAKERLAEVGVEPKVLMSSWSPAQYLKDSESVYGIGTLAKDENGEFVYDEYGEYWAELVKAYNDGGVPIDYVSIQNECDYVAAYESCTFDFVEKDDAASYPKAHIATYDALQKLDNPPKMVAPETMTCEADRLSLFIEEILNERPESLDAIGHHLYVGGDENSPMTFNKHFRSLAMDYPDISKWQTEYYRGDFMQTVQIIQNALMYENLNAYIYWGGVWYAPVGKDYTNLIGIDSGNTEEEWDHEHGYVIGEKYYSMRHFSEYILPDYIRVGTLIDNDKENPLTTDELSCSAFVSPDDQSRMVLVSVNDTDEAKKLQFQFEDYDIENSKVILTNFEDGENTEEFYVESGSLDELQCYELPAHSVITVVLDGVTGITELKDGIHNMDTEEEKVD